MMASIAQGLKSVLRSDNVPDCTRCLNRVTQDGCISGLAWSFARGKWLLHNPS
jgi:hypothetical protein